MCQTCTVENLEEAKQCKQCTQKKTEQKAICGVCSQSTPIPSTNFMDGLVATARDIQQSSRKIYYDVSGKPYLTCGRCSFHVKLPERPAPQAGAGVGAGAGAGAGVAEGQASVPPPAADAGGNGAEGQSSPPPQYASVAQVNGLICPSCKNPLEQ